MVEVLIFVVDVAPDVVVTIAVVVLAADVAVVNKLVIVVVFLVVDEIRISDSVVIST